MMISDLNKMLDARRERDQELGFQDFRSLLHKYNLRREHIHQCVVDGRPSDGHPNNLDLISVKVSSARGGTRSLRFWTWFHKVLDWIHKVLE